MNVILCGLPGSGKSTVGSLLARRLGWTFIDTDRSIEQAYEASTGRAFSCRQIFTNEGELLFRDLEKQHIASLTGVTKSVIAVGGGAVCDPESVALLDSIGLIVYLKVSPRSIFERFLRSDLPPYVDPADPQGSFEGLARKRLPAYEAAANCSIDADGLSVQEVVELITSFLSVQDTVYGK